MQAILIAVIAAVVGSFVTWLFGASDRKQAHEALAAQQAAVEAQQRLAALEAQKSQFDEFTRFSPRVRIVDGDQTKPYLTLEAEEVFEVESMDYMTQNETTVASQRVDQKGKRSTHQLDIPRRSAKGGAVG